MASSLYADLGAEDDEDSLDLSYSSPDEEAVAELRDASASFLDRFEAGVRKELPAFGRAALDREINVCEGRAFEPPLIPIISRHGRECRQALVTDVFKGQAAEYYRAAVNAAVRELPLRAMAELSASRPQIIAANAIMQTQQHLLGCT